jgi:hypothetical protein
VATLCTTGLEHSMAERVGIKQHHDLDARGGGAFSDQLGGQLGGLTEGHSQGGTVFFFDVPPDAIGDHMLAEDQDATDILRASDVRVNRRLFQLGDRVHGRAPCGLLRVMDDQREGFPRRRRQSPQQFLRLLAEDTYTSAPSAENGLLCPDLSRSSLTPPEKVSQHEIFEGS